ncbi:MAG: VWA domain-containing protein [Candidatus Poribacteria bacterium]|nr:VWA domain-containing protein [Candidatus Poribacteria bacterium]
MKVNRILMVTLFFFSITVLIGACQQQANAAEFIFDGYRIDAQLQSYRNSSVNQHGFLDLIQLNSSGELELMYGIQELSVTDRNGMKVPWEEAKSILSQALMRDLHKDDSQPWSLTDWILPVTKFIPVRTDSGHIFEVVATGGFSEVGHRAGVVNTVKAHNSRVELYKTAILRAIAMEQTRYFFEEVLKDDVYTKALDLGESAAKLGLEAADFTDQIATRYVQLRIQSGATQAMAHGASAKVVQLIGNKVKTRFAQTLTGKLAKGARVFRGANKILGSIGVALEVVANVQDQTERDRMLFQLRNDLVVLQGLNDMLALMEAHVELGTDSAIGTDPAMIDGIEAALYELADLSSWRWESVGKGVLKSSPAVLSYLGKLTLIKLGVAGPWGFVAGLAIYQTGEAFKAWNEWEQSILTLSACRNLGNYLHRSGGVENPNSRILKLTHGHFVTDQEPGFPVRELVSFRARLAAEGSAWFYNIIWAKRWSNWLNAANIGDSLGKALPELIFKIRTGQDPQEHWKTLVTERGTAFRYTQEVYTRMPIFLDQLKQVYVPRPTSEPEPPPESTSLADIALIIDSSGSMRNEDPKNLRKDAARDFIDLAGPTVQIAIIDLASRTETSTLAPLTFADEIGKIQLKNAVDRINSDGGNDIATALRQGFNELAASNSSAKKAAVLLTDGKDNSNTHQVVLDYAARGWSVYTIGLGGGVDRENLENIAAATPKGEYSSVELTNLQSVYNKILAKTTGQSTLASYAGYINNGQQITRKVLIDNTVDQANISCNWQGSTIELMLIDPDGTRITPRDAAANPRIIYRPTDTSASYTLENPKPGEWQMQATGTDIPSGGESFYLDVSATSDFSTNLLSLDSSYTVGDTILIGIRVEEKTGDTFTTVSGAMTAAKIVRPDGRVDTLNLYDDGSHNDRAANDGVYANNYRSVDKQGTYLIKVTAENGFSREIQEQVVVGSIDNVLIDGSTLTPAAGAALKQAPSVISAVISGPAGRINANSIVLKVDGNTVSHTYDSINQLVSYRPGGLSGSSHNVKLSLRDTSGNTIETTWQFTIESTVTPALHVYWAEYGGTILRANLDGTNKQILATGLGDHQSIAVDVAGGKIYWADWSWAFLGNPGNGKIQRANLDGTNIQDIVTNELLGPADIDLDVAGGKIYWTNDDDGDGDEKIQRANLDGTNVQDIVTNEELSYLNGIALDVTRGKVYWTQLYKIQRANLDGTNVQDVFVNPGFTNIFGLALDVAGGKIYWGNPGKDKIQCSNLDGSNVQDIITGVRSYSIALDVASGKIYWTDPRADKIQRANLDGSNIQDVLIGLLDPDGIALSIPSQTPPPPTVPEDVSRSKVLFSDDFSSGNLDKWKPRARIGTVENGALKLVGIQGGNYSVDVIKDIFPTQNYARYVLSFDWKSTVKETPYGINHVSAYFYDRTGKLIGQMLALNTGFPNRTFEDHGGDLVPGRYGGVFKVHESFDWERVTLDTATAVPRLNVADVHRIHLRAEVYNDAGSGGDLYVDNFSFAGVSGTPRVVREDVNGDGVVDLQDTAMVTANLGQTGENEADVNGDGVVNVDDLVLVLAAIENALAAPAVRTQLHQLFTAKEVQQWLAEARLSGDTSPAYLRGIAVLEQILALLTPKKTTLLANYPNPFNPETWIPYRLAVPAEVTLTIYAVNGQVVRTLALGHQAAGFYESRSRAAYWDGRNAQGESVASGIYFYTLSAGDFTATGKLLIRK